MSKKIYITTTLPYINAKPHLGHALEFVQTDVLVRAFSILEHDVFFNTGTDEHGTKIHQTAKEMDMETQKYADTASQWFKDLLKDLNIEPTRFIRTSDEEHKKAAQEFWRRCLDKGYIYKKEYTGKYCVGCEMFKAEAELVESRCPLHENQKIEEISETNYFFKLSEFSDYLKELVNSGLIQPKKRSNEVLEFLNKGLEDISISREASRLSWGIPVPGDDTQTMYVWFDALINYISTLGWPNSGKFNEYWDGTSIQIAGKDNVRQQALIWQAMLKSIDLPPTKTIFIHGFITNKGQKMSKSLKNVIDPKEVIEKYGTEIVRYFLISGINPFEDSDIDYEKIEAIYESELVRSVGNITSRVMQMSENYLDSAPQTTLALDENILRNYMNFRFQDAIQSIQLQIKEMDKIIDSKRPFELDEGHERKEIVEDLVIRLNTIATLLSPVIPETTKKIKHAIEINKKPEPLFPPLEKKKKKGFLGFMK